MNDSHLSGQRAPRAEEPKRKNGEDKAGSSDDGGWDCDSEPGAAGRAPGKRDRKTSKRKAATGPWAGSGRGPRGTCYLLARGPRGTCYLLARGPRGTCYLLALPSGLSACTALPSASLGRRKQASEWGPDSSAAGEESARAPASAQPPSRPAVLAPLRPSSTRPRSQRGRRLLVEELLVEGRNPVVRCRGRAGTVGLGSQELPTSRRESLARPPLNAD